MLLNFDFANNTILSWFFFFFLIIDLYFLIAAVIAQIFNSLAELVLEYQLKMQKQKLKYNPVIVEPKIRKYSI